MTPALDAQHDPADAVPGGGRTLRRLVLRLSFLLLLACATLALFAAVQLKDMARQEAAARAQKTADAVAARLTYALELGIPLPQLEGVNAFFDQRLRDAPDVQALALREAGSRRLLWLRGRTPAQASALVVPAGPQVTAAVAAQGATAAELVLVWREPQITGLLQRSAAPLAVWVLALMALAAQALRRHWDQGLGAREALLQQASVRIAGGDFTRRPAKLQRRGHDPRLPWLVGELRYLNEQSRRLHRLVDSLRKTEPDDLRREQLERLLAEAVGQGRFRQDAALPLDAPGLAVSRGRWRGLVQGLIAGAFAAAAAAWAGWSGHLVSVAQGALALAAVGFVAALIAWWRSGPGVGVGVALGLLGLAPGLYAPVLALSGLGSVLPDGWMHGLWVAGVLGSGWAWVHALAWRAPKLLGRSTRAAELVRGSVPAMPEAGRAP